MKYVITAVMDAANGDEEMPEVVEDPTTGEPAFRVFWKDSGGYRGYYDSEPLDPEQWELLDEGCVCGEWDDVPPGTRTSEVEARLNKLAEERDIVVIPMPTSNVFSTGYDCYARKEAS